MQNKFNFFYEFFSFAGQYDTPEKVDVRFWQSFCKRGGTKGSGSYTWLNGWFNVFFPHLNSNSKTNQHCVPYNESDGYAQEDVDAGRYGHRVPPGVAGPDIGDIPGVPNLCPPICRRLKPHSLFYEIVSVIR